MKYIDKISFIMFFSLFFIQACGYKLGGLETIGEDSSKTALINTNSSQSLKRSFINSGFTIVSQNYNYQVLVEGPYYKRETVSVTSNATENELLITGTLIVSILDAEGKSIVNKKIISKTKDHQFSSSNINSSESEEIIIRSDILKYLEYQVINLVRSKI
jgi:outer membrane lipopolysaccharide assembly protein LptE/RlpB|tara:strand:- start:888 stop:1367 length:480 start_codon:yes stop_codon:yes gene_type:complete